MNTTEKILVGIVAFIFLVLVVLLGIILISYGFPGIGNEGVIIIIPLKGEIVSQCNSNDCIDAHIFKKMMKIAEDDANVKAIVIEVDSPGGEVVASREIMEIIKNTKKKKPVIGYIRSIGASGAYYAISASDYIVANEYSLVGSIGVKTTIIQYAGLLDKLGINVTVIKRPKNKDVASPYNKNLSDEERNLFEEIIDEIYNGFVNDVAINRNLSRETVIAISENRSVYLGKNAKKVKLVDEVGNLDDALKIAADKTNIKRYFTKYIYPTHDEGFFKELAFKIGEGIGKVIIEHEEKNTKREISAS